MRRDRHAVAHVRITCRSYEYRTAARLEHRAQCFSEASPLLSAFHERRIRICAQDELVSFAADIECQ